MFVSQYLKQGSLCVLLPARRYISIPQPLTQATAGAASAGTAAPATAAMFSDQYTRAGCQHP